MHWMLINTVLRLESCLLVALLTTDSFILLFSASPKAPLIAFKLVLRQWRTSTSAVICYRNGKQIHGFRKHITVELTGRALDRRSYQRNVKTHNEYL